VARRIDHPRCLPSLSCPGGLPRQTRIADLRADAAALQGRLSERDTVLDELRAQLKLLRAVWR